jgi:hypothetical protein
MRPGSIPDDSSRFSLLLCEDDNPETNQRLADRPIRRFCGRFSGGREQRPEIANRRAAARQGCAAEETNNGRS